MTIIHRDMVTPTFDNATKFVVYKGETYIVPEWVKYITRDNFDTLVCGWDKKPHMGNCGRWLMESTTARWTYAIKRMDATTSFIHEIEG